MNLAVIPARAGSVGIPGKNFRPISGKPLVAWSIEAALNCNDIDLVVVSSNCPEVERITKTYSSRWLKFVPRPEHLCGGLSLTEDALIHSIEYVSAEFSVDPEWVTLLQPTSPVRNNKLLDSCCRVILQGGGVWDSLLTCSKHTPFFYHIGDFTNAVAVQHSPCNRPMRQDLLEHQFLYHDCGNVAITKAEVLLERHCRVGEYPYLMPVSNYQALQVDDPEDFAILESMSKELGSFI